MSTSTKRTQTRRQRADRRMYVPFAGVDGEGGDIDGKHEYMLLRAGRHLLETGAPLGVYECLAFLADLPKDRIYVSFAFDYDVTMMIRHLTPPKMAAIFDRSHRAIRNEDGKETGRYFPVQVGHGRFEIDYKPHQEFRVRRPGQRWTVISDTFTFFQSSFVKALRKWFVDDEWAHASIEKIAEGKEQRGDFGYVTEYERDYNELECLMLEHMMEKFRDLCIELDIKPRYWQGPGHLVSAVFRREGLPKKQFEYVPDIVWLYANNAYFGGRFEASVYGEVTGKVYQYDINSAYASSYRTLPCLQHGTWQAIGSLPVHARDSAGFDDNSIYVADISFHHRSRAHWYTLPVRSVKGTLLFPRTGRGFYWCHEIRVAQQYADIEVHSGYIYRSHCDCRNFDWVYDLYDLRDSVGKDSGKGKVLKIVLATIYGKLAQSKGHPVYSNPIWSGLVVSRCRATLISACLQNGGRDCVMLATDGMFCTEPRKLTTGRDLGEWTLTEHDGMFVIMSGLYFAGSDRPKTRGVPQGKVVEYADEFREVWRRWIKAGNVSITVGVSLPLRVFVGARLAHARGRGYLAGRWQNVRKRVTFEHATKRCRPRIVGNALWTDPVDGSSTLVSQPPQWMIGGQVDLELEDQPDWVNVLTEVD